MSDDQKISRLQGMKLAELVHELRPGWGVKGIFEQIGAAVQEGFADPFELALSSIRAAQDQRNQTPAIIRMPGKHRSVEEDLKQARADLKAAQDKLAGKYTPPSTNDPRCEEHPDEYLSSCRECAKVKTPMPKNFRELAGIVPKQHVKRPRKLEQVESDREPTHDETKPGEGHAA